MQVFKVRAWDDLKTILFYIKDFILIPYFRRIIRFLALPYCFFYLVNWKECKTAKLKVLSDFIYIFFVLKYFPDNYSLCRLWEKKKEEWVYYYGSNYDPFQRRQLRRRVQRKEYEIIFEDKNICYQLCKAGELPLPKQIGYIENSKELNEIIENAFRQNPSGKFIVKPVMGSAGNRIMLIKQEEKKVFIKKEKELVPLNSIRIDTPYVIQEYLSQHPEIAKFHPNSVNTIRIVTLLAIDNSILFLGAFIRFGADNAFVDNTSQGGVAVSIDLERGCLNESGYDFSSKRHTTHPTTNIVFEGYRIPFWNDVLSLAQKTQYHFNYFKLLGHDIAITEEGPAIIELNAIYDNVGLEQKCGPILKNKNVLYEYNNYNLLINSKQRQLLNNSI
jgi:hypothetical protein